MSARFSIDYLIGNNQDENSLKRKRPKVQLTPKNLILEAHLAHGLQKVRIRLEGATLWQRFHQLGTEMIVTKSGR